MRYDIVSLKTGYKGFCRPISTYDFKNLKGKDFNDIINIYFEYINLISCEFLSKSNFDKLINIHKKIKEKGVNCEVIAYDNCQLIDVFGYKIDFLGLDIDLDLAESLLKLYYDSKQKTSFSLNNNFLCNNLSEAERIITLNQDQKWSPCWVYKVYVD